MKKPFFVMMYMENQRHAEPIVDDNRETMFWGTYEEALEAMDGHSAAIAFGFEIFEMN